MLIQIAKALSWAAAVLCLVCSPARTEGGHADQQSQDIYRACNRRPPPPSTMMADREKSIFAVWVTRPRGLERTGTATLIDDGGIFVTAAHSVYYDKNHTIRITQKLRGRQRVVLRGWEALLVPHDLVDDRLNASQRRRREARSARR